MSNEVEQETLRRFIENRGHPITHSDFSERGFDREGAHALVAIARRLSRCILGGDFYVLADHGRFVPALDNWHFEPSRSDFCRDVRNSCKAAHEQIERRMSDAGGTELVSMVFSGPEEVCGLEMTGLARSSAMDDCPHCGLTGELAEEVRMDWQDGLFGIEHGLCSASSCADLLVAARSEHAGESDDIVRLCLANSEREKCNVIRRVCEDRPPNDGACLLRKWIVMEVKAARRRFSCDIGRLTEEIELLCGDLCYPPSVVSLFEHIKSVSVGKFRKDGRRACILELLDEFLEQEASELALVSK